MDAMHEAGIKAFPAKTEGKGNQLLEPRMEGGVKVFELTAEEIAVGGRAGQDGEGVGVQRPGARPADPRARGRPRARRLTNELPGVHRRSTSTASSCPNDQDGVPFITQPPIKPGESFTYEFTVPERRLAHVPLAPQRGEAGGSGLLGAFIVEPKRPRRDRARRTWTT